MEEQSAKTVTAFDSLFTSNKIQMLKILLPRLIPEQQGGFAVYIKLLELQYTLTFLRRYLPDDCHPLLILRGMLCLKGKRSLIYFPALSFHQT